MTEPADDEFTEIYDADIPRVDLVGKGANGIPFLIAKADEAGVLPAGFVRDLIAKADPQQPEPAPARDDVTITGSPAAVMKMIHEAALRGREDVEKAQLSSKSINDLPDSDFAYIEPGGSKDNQGKTEPRSLRHFPIQDAAHVRNALSRAPQSPFGDKAMPKIRAAAKKLGIDVSKEQHMPDTVAKDDAAAVDVSDLIPDAPSGSTANSVPGSPAWEQLDHDTAQNAIGTLARVKAALEYMSDREAQEAVTADPDDADAAFNLQDMSCQIDCVINQLAGYAVGEQIEADLADELDAVGKAAATLAEPLRVLEQLGPVKKAGRVLSAVNEQRIKTASDSLAEVLATLPQAPTVDDGQTVAKSDQQKKEEAAMSEPTEVQKAADTDDAATTSNVVKTAEPNTVDEPAQTVEKAKGDPLVICYDANGKAIGLIDPEKLQPIADGSAAPASDKPADPAPAAASAAAPTATPTAAPAAPPADTAPENPAAAGTPAGAPAPEDPTVAKSNDGADDRVAELVKAALTEEREQTATLVKSLEDRIAHLEASPAPSTVYTNGAVPPAHLLRGQNNGAVITPTEQIVQNLRKQFADSSSPAERDQAAKTLNEIANAQFAAMLQNPQ